MTEKNYQLQHVNLITEDHLELPGLFFSPQKPTKIALIYLHGNGGSSIFYKVDFLHQFASALAEQSIAFLPFNNRGAHFLKQFSWWEGNEKKRRYVGASNELIADCILDIKAAIHWLKEQGYETFYLYGHSTGANKVCVYNHSIRTEDNPFAGYILSAGGDDTGWWYKNLGEASFWSALEKSRQSIAQGKGEELIFPVLNTDLLTHQSFVDMADPDGDYNCFPFLEQSGQAQLSHQPLFHYYQEISKPTLAIYGSEDYFCVVPPQEAVEILRERHAQPEVFQGKVIPNADHSFYPQEDKLISAVTEWMSAQKQ